MSSEPIPLLGGKSVYCINESQLKEAFHLAEEDPEASPRIKARLEELEAGMSRNERAALAFVIIDRLLKTRE
jgi:PHD/YefM family antitoxin component YafN of YafNO toxin-antitoxin module